MLGGYSIVERRPGEAIGHCSNSQARFWICFSCARSCTTFRLATTSVSMVETADSMALA